MSHPFRQRLSNSLSLLALLINLLPPVPLVQAHAEPLTPAEHAHQSPAPTLIASRESLTPITTRADAVLPRWFKPPVASSMDSDQTAVLSLAKPAALVELEARRQRPVISSQKAEAKNQPPAAVLPGWFAPAHNVILSEAKNPSQPQQPAGLAADTAQPIENANTPSVNASVLPGWFASSANSEKGLGTASTSVPALGEPPSAPVLPNWFNTHPSQIPNPTPSAPRLAAQSLNPQLPAVSGQR
ncbi:MAG TPA: hypothetical protein VEC93_16625, partial [Anaerolineae bacterium]|nr:hypothetical protein [Anaerolineae bacterium]